MRRVRKEGRIKRGTEKLSKEEERQKVDEKERNRKGKMRGWS